MTDQDPSQTTPDTAISDTGANALPASVQALIGDEPVAVVRADHTEYVLLGTAHVSHTSAEVVERLVGSGYFDAVAIELCSPRYEALTQNNRWRDMDLFAVLRDGKAGMMMASLALSAYQRRIAEQLGIEPGAEMKVAVAAANTRELPIHLIDRDIGITLRRASAHLGWWRRWVMLNGLFFSMFSKEEVTAEEIESLKQGDLLDQTFSQFAEASPELYEGLIAERDRYMAAKLQLTDQDTHSADDPHKVLAVIGAGHLTGTETALRSDAPPQATIDALEYAPPKSSIWKVIPWVVLILVVSGFGLGFSRSPELGWALVATWVLINGSLSAVGAALARAHPLTVLTALIAAPLTSLNPTVGAGMVTGAVEAWLRKPTVGDFDALRDDAMTLKGWYHNRISRVFLVFFLSNLGSAAGTWIAGFSMVSQLSGGS
jgi:pheromone shutdown-related protein TraB